MINCTVFMTIEHLCRRFSSKDGRSSWCSCHVLVFGDPAQLPPVSNTDTLIPKHDSVVLVLCN